MTWAHLIEDKERRRAFEALEKLCSEVWGSPETTGEIPPLDQRFSVSVTKVRDVGFVPTVHVDREDSSAFQQARELLERYPFIERRLGGGDAQAAYPESKAKKHAVTGQLAPGAAISHGRYRFGTLGCIVEAEIDKIKCKCAVTAAHVVSLNSAVQIGDEIFCPGNGSVRYKKKGYKFGVLSEAIQLHPLNPAIRGEVDSAEDIAIESDVALVRIMDDRELRMPIANVVPDPADPENPEKKIKVTAAVREEDLGTFLIDDVYLFGAVSGFSQGVLTDIGINKKILRLPNRKNYMYIDLLGIAPPKGQAFSQPGDSGAMIYTKNGLLLGFLVGADNNMSFACIGARALGAFEARMT
jgi:hypothetical protein